MVEHRARLRLQARSGTPLLDHLRHSLHPARRRGKQS